MSDIVRGPLQAVAWLALGAAGIVLTLSESASLEITGIAVSEAYAVRSQREGLIHGLHVSPGDLVQAGTIIATLDARAHGLELELSRQQLAALAAEVGSTLANQRVDAAIREIEAGRRDLQLVDGGKRQAADAAANRERQRDRAARLAIEHRRIQLSLATMEAGQVGRQVAARRARLIAKRATKLASDGVDRLASAIDLGLEADELEASVEAFERSIQTTREQLTISTEQLEAASTPAEGSSAPTSPDTGEEWARQNQTLEQTAADADLAAITALERRLDVARAAFAEIEAKAVTFEVKSPIAGRITGVAVALGSVVLGGEAVATVQAPHATEIQIFLPERGSQETIPKEYLVARAVDPRRTAQAEVVRVTDRLTQLPRALQLNPTRMARGRALHLRIPEGFSILSGERVIASPLAASD